MTTQLHPWKQLLMECVLAAIFGVAVMWTGKPSILVSLICTYPAGVWWANGFPSKLPPALGFGLIVVVMISGSWSDQKDPDAQDAS
jgi:hypothetical protein